MDMAVLPDSGTLCISLHRFVHESIGTVCWKLGYPHAMAAQRPPDELISPLVFLVLACLLAWPLDIWWLDVAATFRIQIGAITLLMCLARVSAYRLRSSALWAVCTVVCLWGSLTDETVAKVGEGTRHLRVMVQNVHTRNRAFGMVTYNIRSNAPDVVALLETDELWTGALRADLDDILPHVSVNPRTDNFGISMLSAIPMDVEVIETPPLNVPSIEALVLVEGRLVRIIATHPIPPLSQQYARLRNLHIEQILQRLEQRPLPTVLMGDFNLAPTSPSWTRLFGPVQLLRVQDQPFPVGSWPSILGRLGISIDHVLISQQFSAVDLTVLPSVGSDHRGLMVDLQMNERQ